MSWLEEAKKRAEGLGDIPDSLRVLAPEDGVEFLKVSRRIADEDAPRAYALLERARKLIEHLREPAMLAGLKITVDVCDSFLRDLEGKEETDAKR